VSILGAVTDGDGAVVDFVLRFSNPAAQALLRRDAETSWAGPARTCSRRRHLPDRCLGRGVAQRHRPPRDVRRHPDGTASWVHQRVIPLSCGVAVASTPATDANGPERAGATTAMGTPGPPEPPTAALPPALTDITHDLITPLHALVGFAEVLRTEQLDADQQVAVEQIRRAAAELSRIVHDRLEPALVPPTTADSS
jgi:signal transduction histidine kinase